MLFPEAFDKTNINRVLTSPEFKKALFELETDREKYLNTPARPLPFNLFKLFYTEGNRRLYEDIYFERRGQLTAFFMSAMLYGRAEDIRALEDIIWDICDEYTWALPAHSADLGDGFDAGVVDLFSAETGFALAEIYYIMRGVLDRKVVVRMLENIEKRIFTPYETRKFWWETSENNWAAVCAGSVGAAYIYTAPERFPAVRERIDKTLSCFLQGFGNDGACLEGIGYWNYGFGYFTYYAQLLKEFSDGEYNLFDNQKCKKIALFQQSAFMRKNYTVSFSDGYQKWSYLPGLTQKLYDIYGGEIYAPPSEYAEFDEYCHRFAAYTRNFFWTAAGTMPHKSFRETQIYYPDAQWYIVNRSSLSLAAKAGHNDEPHNHNDIGSFTLLDDDGYILCDFGCGEYCREYFDPDTRYDFICNASRGHSLPLINGEQQRPGREFHGSVIRAQGGKFTAELAGAYGDCGISSLIRSVHLSEDNAFTLRDTFDFKDENIKTIERFVTLIPPVFKDNVLKIGKYTLLYDKTLTPKISSEHFLDHFAKDTVMYMIDFEMLSPKSFTLQVIA